MAATNFYVVENVTTPFNGVEIFKYRSSKTGLTVVVANTEGPLVNGFFTLSTEAFDDDGCPHTLEHLIFLGSELYPYKGVLDSLANRALARGTNAWTATDHTCYTITTAGSTGFLNILPVYLDHILYPTLTSTGCYTEVHHIDGEGNNAGVVYCEMQGRQNTQSDRMQLRLNRLLYPENIGYRSETGGLMENLRELKVEKIRQYHKDYYNPHNLCIIVVGTINHSELLSTLHEFDERIASKGVVSKGQRPWVDSIPPPPLSEDVDEVIEFPDEDETSGSVYIAWRGPMFFEHLEKRALDIIGDYLTDSEVSLLNEEFVEIDDPLCNEISFTRENYIQSEICISFSNVAVDKIFDFKKKLFNLFDELVENDGEEIDMERIALVINRARLQAQDEVESIPAEAFCYPAISDFLYGNEKQKDMPKEFEFLGYLKELEKYTAKDWANLIKKYFIDQHHVLLQGKPSKSLAKKLETDEKDRIQRQREELGDEKLKGLREELEKAKLANEVEIPVQVSKKFPVTSVEGINVIPVITAQSHKLDKDNNKIIEKIRQDTKGNDVPQFIQFDHVKSSFVEVRMIIDTQSIPDNLRPLLPSYVENFFTLPVMKENDNGILEEMDFEDVVTSLNEDSISHECTIGLGSYHHFSCGGFPQYMFIEMKVETSKYDKAIGWLRDLLFRSIFLEERLKINIMKLVNDIPEYKRDGSQMASAALKMTIYDNQKSNNCSSNILRQAKYLPKIIEDLDKNPGQIKDQFEKIRKILTKPENIRIHIVGDILKLNSPRGSWCAFNSVEGFAAMNITPNPIVYSKGLLSLSGERPGNKGYCIPMPSIESSFSVHVTKGPTSEQIDDIASLLVLNEYLQTMEGPFWKQIRGQGLAYSCSFSINKESGLLNFQVYRAPDASKAFKQAYDILHQFNAGEIQFDEVEVEGARAAVIYSIIEKEATMSDAALQSLVHQVMYNTTASYNKDLLERVEGVTIEKMKRMLGKYTQNLFNSSTSNMVVVSGPGKAEDILHGFKEIGFKLEFKSIEEMEEILWDNKEY